MRGDRAEGSAVRVRHEESGVRQGFRPIHVRDLALRGKRVHSDRKHGAYAGDVHGVRARRKEPVRKGDGGERHQQHRGSRRTGEGASGNQEQDSVSSGCGASVLCEERQPVEECGQRDSGHGERSGADSVPGHVHRVCERRGDEEAGGASASVRGRVPDTACVERLEEDCDGGHHAEVRVRTAHAAGHREHGACHVHGGHADACTADEAGEDREAIRRRACSGSVRDDGVLLQLHPDEELVLDGGGKRCVPELHRAACRSVPGHSRHRGHGRGDADDRGGIRTEPVRDT